MTFIEGLPGGGSKTRLDVGETDNPSPPGPGIGFSTLITTALDVPTIGLGIAWNAHGQLEVLVNG